MATKRSFHERIVKWFHDSVQVIYGSWTEKELKTTISSRGLVLVLTEHEAHIREKNGRTIASSPLSFFE